MPPPLTPPPLTPPPLTPPPLTPDKLFERALRYLERFAASAEGVRQVLRRGVQRDERRGERVLERETVREWIEEVIARLLAAGLLNDRLFAETKVRSLRRRGASTHRIRQKLAVKGVDADVITDALTGEDAGDDASAALAFARKRRLGPFAPPATREENKAKHLAALARAGFSFALSHRLIGAATPDALEPEDDEGTGPT